MENANASLLLKICSVDILLRTNKTNVEKANLLICQKFI